MVAISYESRLSGLPEDSQKNNWDRPASLACQVEKAKAYDGGLACAVVWDSKS